nr:MAG TPA: hypothetical protein [Caudoviricetes sp.]
MQTLIYQENFAERYCQQEFSLPSLLNKFLYYFPLINTNLNIYLVK